MALRASSAAESPVIYVLLSESSRFKSEVSGQGSVPYMFVCVFGCVYERVCMSHCHSLQTQMCVCVCVSEKLHEGQPKAPSRVPWSIWLGGAPFV